ncbi:hypothetical protein F4777DRAFT_531157 [Nemania sp. FL0916]|nr:hypothetical protein F4777DRAFT_531157 [Nemania sp. FL0916]
MQRRPLPLMADARQETQPALQPSRIKRNAACTSCRDAKVQYHIQLRQSCRYALITASGPLQSQYRCGPAVSALCEAARNMCC